METHFGQVEEILGGWREALGEAFPAYRNHVYRVLHFAFALRECHGEEREKMIIAASFHDLGIWTANTYDYLAPSISLARDYLRDTGRENWVAEIDLIIEFHHKFRAIKTSGLAETFRRADWIDVSKGLLRFGLPRETIRTILKAFPNAGFHRELVRLTREEFKKHPLNPLPMMKW
ncbi:MAG: hypothetical protein KDI06_22170 [Calditrichaeota bacterium]|nr:hypothetical protein [Calditrichota bacterium]HQU72325.1 hypothetical protein [Calditrichia bacterium]